MTSVARAAADLSALLPRTHPIARIARARLAQEATLKIHTLTGGVDTANLGSAAAAEAHAPRSMSGLIL